MRGWAKFYETRSKTKIAQAKDLFDGALRLDPDNVEAMVGKAHCVATEVNTGWSASVVEDKKQAIDLIDRVLNKSPASARAHVRSRETFFDMDTLSRRWLNTMLRSKSIQTIRLANGTKQSHLSSPGGRAKPSSPAPDGSPSQSQRSFRLSLALLASAMHTCTCTNIKKPLRNVGARSI